MKKFLVAVILGLSLFACPILYFAVGPVPTGEQLETLKILGIIAGISALYCFVVGEITRNNSQMDKLWSILPIVYLWVVAVRGGMTPRLITMAGLATLWGLRLTYNFARKGAYSLKFWTGEEDYRWAVLRTRKEFRPRWKWALFDLFFISIYQNVLVLIITLPAVISMGSTNPFGMKDWIASFLVLFFLVFEAVADEQQWTFQNRKKSMLGSGKQLNQLPSPYDRGFNTTGLWNRSRHPNYFGEQGVWASMYLFSVGAGVNVFNWSIVGALLLILLFIGSSAFAEEISSGKYPEYAEYKNKVSKFFPGKRYDEDEKQREIHV